MLTIAGHQFVTDALVRKVLGILFFFWSLHAWMFTKPAVESSMCSTAGGKAGQRDTHSAPH